MFQFMPMFKLVASVSARRPDKRGQPADIERIRDESAIMGEQAARIAHREVTLKTSDGARLRVRGLGEGRPLVFVHGWAMSGDAFWPQEALASQGFQVILPDLRGFGGSSQGRLGAGIDVMAGDVGDLCAALELEDAIAVGWSMGASVLWEALADPRLAARFSGLVTIDMSPRVAPAPDWTLGLRNGRAAADAAKAAAEMIADWPAYCARFVARIPAEGADRPDLTAPLARLALANCPQWCAAAWTSLTRHDARAALAAIALPTLAVHGADSRLYPPETAAHVAAASPNGQSCRLAGAGHAPHLEAAAAFNALLSDFARAQSRAQETVRTGTQRLPAGRLH